MAVALLCSVGAMAQSAEHMRWQGTFNNSFWSNWEISLGGGVNYTAWHKLGFKQKQTGDVGWQVEIGATKWFNPIVGARLQYVVGQLNSSDNNGLKGTWMMPHAEGIINLSNWIGGYREDRLYYAKLFAGAGVSFVNVGNDGGYGFAGVAGMINTFRVSDAFDINLELKGALMAGRDMPRGIDALAKKCGQIYSLSVGVTYRFNNRNWMAAYSQADVDAYLAAIAALEVEALESAQSEQQLAQQLEAQTKATDQALAENKTLRQDIKIEQQHTVIGEWAIFFNLNSARLLDRAKASLELVTKAIKEAPADRIFTIVGHADAKTGSPAYNQTLSEKRAKAVYEYLIKHGIDSSRLTWKGVGSTDSIFPVYYTNRVVIIK